ncbi:Retrovirus-related Pol polyprotein from transposon TNT 1-94, partial [Glycine soja]
TDNFVQPVIPRFYGHYDHWSMLMENFLRSKEYWQVVSYGIPVPEASMAMTNAKKTEIEGLRLKDLKAKNYLFQAIDRPVLGTILCKDTSKDIWDSQLQTLRSKFETLRMKSGESVTYYFSQTMAIVNKMRIHGDKKEDITIVEKILRSMTPKFNFVVCSIEEAHDIKELSIDEFQSSLLIHEKKINDQDIEEQALKVSIENRSTSKGEKGRGKGRGKGIRGRDKSDVECYQCHRYDHYQSECQTNLNKDNGEKTNFVEKEEEVSLLMVCHVKEETQQNMWYLDTGCSNHMC